MADQETTQPLLQALRKQDYDVRCLDDEIRVDRLCVDLLKHLFLHLNRELAYPPLEAGQHCQGADHFLREFVVADRCLNLFAIDGKDVRQFAGHWYIIRTLEPNLDELGAILAGTKACYRFLASQGLVSDEQAEAVARACDDRDYYRRRIEMFWAIEGDGYEAWRAACPLDPPGKS